MKTKLKKLKDTNMQLFQRSPAKGSFPDLFAVVRPGVEGLNPVALPNAGEDPKAGVEPNPDIDPKPLGLRPSIPGEVVCIFPNCVLLLLLVNAWELDTDMKPVLRVWDGDKAGKDGEGVISLEKLVAGKDGEGAMPL